MKNTDHFYSLEEWSEVAKKFNSPLVNQLEGLEVSVLGVKQDSYPKIEHFPKKCHLAHKLVATTPEHLHEKIKQSSENGQFVIHLDEKTCQYCFQSFEDISIALDGVVDEKTFFILHLNEKQLFTHIQTYMQAKKLVLKGIVETNDEYIDVKNPHLQSVLIQSHVKESMSKELADIFLQIHRKMERAYQQGIEVETFLRNVVIQTHVQHKVFASISKLRAIRRLWQHFIQHHQIESIAPTIIVETKKTGSMYEEGDDGYIVATLQAFAGIVGGGDFLHLDSQQTDEGARLVQNIQHILLEESKVTNVKDSFAGSYSIEDMTYTLCEQAWAGFCEELVKDNSVM